VNRRLALALVLLLTAVALAAALLPREGSDAGSEEPAEDAAACAAAFWSPRVELAQSADFNFGDAVACGQSDRRPADAGPREPPK
jgi:hypothetical protein